MINMNMLRKIIILPIIFVALFGFSITVNAGETVDTNQGTPQTIHNPLERMADGNTDAHALVGVLIKNIMGLAGTIGLVMFVWGGFLMMTAAGNKDQVGKGKETITWAAIGIIVIFTSYSLVSFILQIMSGS